MNHDRVRGLPDPMPTHYDSAGNVTSWADSLLLGLVSLAGAGILAEACVLISHRHDARFPDGRPDTSCRLQLGTARSLQRAMSWIAVLMAIAPGAVAVAPVVRLSPAGSKLCVRLLTAG